MLKISAFIVLLAANNTFANSCWDKRSDPKGADYTGNVAQTKSHPRFGVRPCRPWSEMFGKKMPEDGKYHNFCRNPGGSQRAPFCWVKEGFPGPKFGFCDIPDCKETTTVTSTTTTTTTTTSTSSEHVTTHLMLTGLTTEDSTDNPWKFPMFTSKATTKRNTRRPTTKTTTTTTTSTTTTTTTTTTSTTSTTTTTRATTRKVVRNVRLCDKNCFRSLGARRTPKLKLCRCKCRRDNCTMEPTKRTTTTTTTTSTTTTTTTTSTTTSTVTVEDHFGKLLRGPLGKETPYETELSRKVVSKPAKTKEFANLGGSSSNYGQCGRQSLPRSGQCDLCVANLMGPHCSPLHNEIGLGVMDRSGRMIDTTHDAGYLECKNLRYRRESDYYADYNYEYPTIQQGIVPVMPDDYEMYEYEYESTNNGTKLEARSRVPTSPGESNDEIDTLCEENPKECAKKHLNLMGFSLPFFTGMKRGSSKTRSGKVEHATFQCSSGKNAAKALKTSAGGIECGTETASRIINGAKVAAKELPWMISIRDYLGFPFCGGTILTPEYSITAAHCREFRRLKEYKITTGHLEREYRVAKREEGFQESQLADFISHPKWDETEIYMDVALLKMAKPFKYTEYVKPACLINSNFEIQSSMTGCMISGWGNAARTGYGSKFEKLLMKGVVGYVDKATCNEKHGASRFGDIVAQDGTQFCFMSNADQEDQVVDSCQGDSGGPIQCIVDGEWTIVGVVSWGRGCAKKGMPGIYTRLADVRVHDWVQKYIH